MYRGRSLFLNTSLHFMQLCNDHIYHLATVDMGKDLITITRIYIATNLSMNTTIN